MAKIFNSNSPLSSSKPTPSRRTVKPSSEFYSIFSEEEVLGIVHALEFRREIPLKYSYKGRGAKIWDNFYLKYIFPTWFRTSSLEIDLLKDNFEYINGNFKNYERINERNKLQMTMEAIKTKVSDLYNDKNSDAR
ncbi:MAG: hypothetical protein ICV55_16095, partial [Coleofasciculus sp. C3-bin4]|nr:hypothetical protein [Coleofasciculus sp. C3-bin4]